MAKSKTLTPPTVDVYASISLALWGATFLFLAIVPDQKILRYKLIAVETGVAALAALVLARWVVSRNALWRRTPLDIPVGLYAAGGVLFYLLSPERGVSSLELTRTFFCALTFFAATQTFPLIKRPERLILLWSCSAGLVGLYALLQLRGGLGPLLVPLSERPFATFGNPIFLAAYLASAVAAGAGLLSRLTNRKAQGACLLGMALAAGGLLATQSRAAYVGLGGTFALAVIFSLQGRKRWSALFVVAAGLAVAAALAGFGARQWTHGLIWRDTLALWKDYPLFGCGLGRFHIEFPGYASEALKSLWPQRKVIINFAHNEYLQILAETGIVGLGLFLFIPVSAAMWLLRAKQNSPSDSLPGYSGSFALAAGALLLQNFFSPDIRFGLSSFLLFFCLGAAVARFEDAGVPLPAFPGRFGLASIGAAALTVWSYHAVMPLLAQRHLSRQPGFHIPVTKGTLDTLAVYEGKLAADPTNADLAENLAYLYAKQKRWPQAVSRFELAARLDPLRPGPLNNLGNIYYSTGNKQNAIKYWKRSLIVKKDQIDANLNLGKTLYEVGRLKESSRHLQAVLEKDPGNEKALILLKKMVE